METDDFKYSALIGPRGNFGEAHVHVIRKLLSVVNPDQQTGTELEDLPSMALEARTVR